MKTLRYCLSLCFILVISLQLSAQNNDTIIPYPKGTVTGTLSNGLRYILKQNSTPADKIDVRLLVKTGSANEQKNESGVAHFLEHMAFNGSKNYPKRTAIEYWESLGAKFGTSINAYTNYDRTVYYLSIPSDKTHKNILKTLRIYADWVNNLTLSKKSIEKERGIVLQELANFKDTDHFSSTKKGNLPQLTKLPIGSKKQIEQIQQNTLQQFYNKWYSPQNITLIVVGTIHPKQVQTQIQKAFGTLKNKGSLQPPIQPIKYTSRFISSTFCDTTQNSLQMEVIFPKEYNNAKTIDEHLLKEQKRFAIQLIKSRLLSQNHATKIGYYWYLFKTNFLSFSIKAKNDSLLYNNYQKTLALIEGIKEKGFFKEEINDNLPEFIERLHQRIYPLNSSNWCDNFIDMEVFNERHLWNKEQYSLLSKKLKNTSLKQWKQIVKSVFTYKNPIVLHTYNCDKQEKPSVLSFKKIMRTVSENIDTTFQYKSAEKEQKLTVPKVLKQPIYYSPSMIKSEKYYPNLQLTEIRLKNGVRILFRKTDTSDNKVNINIIANGGLSLIPPNEYWKYDDTFSYIDLGGFEKLQGEAYANTIIQEELFFLNTIENYYHGCILSAPVNKSLLLCNLLYNKWLYPELCYKDFNEIKQDEIKAISKPQKESAWDKNILIKMDAEVEKFTGNTFPYADIDKTKEQLKALNLDSISTFYKKHFPVANQLTCVVLGTFDDTLKENLIGTLSRLHPANHTKQYYNSSFDFPYKVKSKKVGNLKDNRLHFRDIYYGNFTPNLHTELTLKLMRDVLRNRLIQLLREENSLIYSPYITLKYSVNPKPLFYFSIDGTTNPNYGKKVRIIVKNIIKSLQEKNITTTELQKIKQSFLITKKEHLNGNLLKSWTDYLTLAVKNNIDLRDIDNYESVLNRITVKDIKTAFNKMISLQNEMYFYVGDLK